MARASPTPTDNNRLQLQGQPVLRLRADAVHTANLLRKPACSLFVQVILLSTAMMEWVVGTQESALQLPRRPSC